MPRHFVPCSRGEIWDGTNVQEMTNIIQANDPNAVVQRNSNNGAELEYISGGILAYSFQYGDAFLVGTGFISGNDMINWREV